MELLKKFVCEDREYSTYEKNIPAPLFRKSFTVQKEIEDAQILISGLGFYDLYVNGKKITKGFLAPYISNTDHYVYYDRYDLKPYLTLGENVIGVMLGDGYIVGKTNIWNFKDNVTNSAPMLAVKAEITCEDEKITFDAEDFLCKKGPVIFNDLRSGVFYDARLEEIGWCTPGFKEAGWHKPIKAVPPRGKMKQCEAEPIKIYREISPVSIQQGEIEPYVGSEQITEFIANLKPFEKAPDYAGGYIYDFGENNSGIYRLKIKGQKGQRIDIQCAEQLTNGKMNYSNINFFPDGFCQRDIYYLKGEGEEIFEPMFTYHGYRYIYVSGITQEQATKDLLTYLVMSSELEERGNFECSDEMANRIYQMARRSDLSNFFYYPIDCPHREKNGWTGDASVSAEHMIMTMGAEKSWREWLNNIRASQTEAGDIPGIIPTDEWGYGEGPAWDSVLFNLPYYAWKYRGDTQIIRENASAMLRYLEFISKKRDKNGIVTMGLGDWVPVGKFVNEYDADLGFTGSVMVLDICRKSAKMFQAVGLTLHKAFAEKLGQEILRDIRLEYVDTETFTIKKECQTSQAMAIFYDVFTEEEKRNAFVKLMELIRQADGEFTCGFLGMRVLFHVLAEYGEAELAYHMITKKEFPSYGYWADKGETTLLESFQVYDQYYEYSKNHHFLGDVVNWFMSRVGGLQVKNVSTVEINPYFIDKLDWCKTSHIMPAGKVEICWERKDKKIELQIRKPESISCQLRKQDQYRYQETITDTDIRYVLIPKGGC